MEECLAVIVGCDIRDVPNLPEKPDHYWKVVMRRWLLSRGFHCVKHDKPVGLCIAVGDSPRGAWHHAVVWFGISVKHDPYLGGNGFDGKPPFHYWIIRPIDDPIILGLMQARDLT